MKQTKRMEGKTEFCSSRGYFRRVFNLCFDPQHQTINKGARGNDDVGVYELKLVSSIDKNKTTDPKA